MQNKLTRTIKEAFETTFHELQGNTKAKLLAWAKDNPGDFYKLAARLIPHDMKISGKLTLEELLQEASKK